ncbi:MAG: TonB-dependent receptor [Balneolaceae bacterium]
MTIQVLPVRDLHLGGKNIGVSTNRDGIFRFTFNYTYPFRLRFSHISFATQDIIINSEEEGQNMTVLFVPASISAEDVVVTADLVSKEELEETETIYKISTIDVQQLASFDVFDLISTVREVDVATQSMTMQSVNTRGFNSSANKRFLQLTDGIDSRAPGLNFPIGNLMGLIDLDVASVEILPGPASTQYGSSALNGVMLMASRDPFYTEGFTMEVKTGVNNLNLSGDSFFAAEGNGIYDFQGRYAKVFSDKFAFKVTGAVTRGTDWQAKNYDNNGLGDIHKQRENHPGYDGVNIYGDENFVYQQVYIEDELIEVDPGVFVLPEADFGPLTRTGYRESDLVDYDISTSKLAASLHYKISPSYRIKIDGKYGYTHSLYTGDSRIRLDGFRMYQTTAEFELDRLNVKTYSTWQNSGDSFDVSYLAQKLIQGAKADEDWYRDFRIAFQNGIPVHGVRKGNLADAREFADSRVTLLPGRNAKDWFEPGTPEFEEKKDQLVKTVGEDGVAFQDNSSLYHLESSYDLTDLVPFTSLKAGGNFRFYDIESYGTIFPDTTSNNITNYEFGGYLTAGNRIFNEQLRINSALRFDKNENFEPRISPQVSLNYNLNDTHYFTFAYQHGFRYPGVREQFINNNLGNARLIGGLAENVDPYNLQGNSIYINALDEFNEAVNNELNQTPYSPEIYNRTQAELKHLPILESGIVSQDQLKEISPEVVNTLEAGYRHLFTPQFYFDLNYYVSFYNNFIGVTRVIKPRTSPSQDLFVAAGQTNNTLENDRYYVYSNAADQLIVQGASFNIDYSSGGFMASLNASYAKLIQSSDDPITPGFNTPPFKMNFEWGHRSIAPNVGFKMVYRYRTKFFWESSFIDGPIDNYGHFDFQINTRIPSIKSSLKFGVTNFGIGEYYNIYGGPSIGSIIFTTLTFNPKII